MEVKAIWKTKSVHCPGESSWSPALTVVNISSLILRELLQRRSPVNAGTRAEISWFILTKSFFYQKGLGANSSEAQIEKLHPAPYSFQDIGHLVRFFTKQGMRVLDPFGGVGSTAKACEVNGRICTSIELSERWHKLSIQRLETEVGAGANTHHKFINGDSCEELLKLETSSFDFVVTSPPYWGILNKQDQKVKKNALVENKAWWIEDDIYDYDTGTDGYRNACDITNKWFSVANELRKRIFIILRSEKTVIPERGYNTVLKPFMERNGFVDGRGWWIHKEKSGDD